MNKKTSFSFKRDKYNAALSGPFRLFNISCRKCESIIAVYQKDGPGNLRRMYMDRIFAPINLVKLQDLNVKDIPILKCQKCGEILGTPYIYQKKKRKSFRLYQDAVIKQPRKLRE